MSIDDTIALFLALGAVTGGLLWAAARIGWL